MNVKLNWNSTFLGICVDDERMYPNNFSVEMSMITKSENPRHQYVAFERMRIVVSEIFANSIFIGADNDQSGTFISLYPNKVIVLPENSYDQIIGLALLCKINAVMENVISCVKLKISSSDGDMVWYEYVLGEDIGPFAWKKPAGKKKHITPWWMCADLSTFNITDKVEMTQWEELSLGWEEVAENITVIHGNTQIIDIQKLKLSGFNAEIVIGGKTEHNED